MKICLMTSIFDPFNSGAGKHVTMLAKELSSQHEVIVISAMGYRRKRNGPNSNPNTIEANSKKIKSLYNFVSISSSPIDRVKYILWLFLRIWNPLAYTKIKKILDSEKPDIIHTHTIKGFSPSVFSAIKDSGIPHVHTLHDYEMISPWPFLFRNGKAISKFNLLERIFIQYELITSPGIDAVISPSQFTMDSHTKLGFFKNSKKYVIPHGIVLNKERLPKKEGGKEFLFIGWLENFKGPDIAVKAFKRIQDKDARLHIVGEGPDLDFLKQIANGDERIIFHGFVSNKEDWSSIFGKCSYLIYPSICYETFGYPLVEAMNNGLPVLGSNFGAIQNIVRDGYNGFLFEPGNIDSLNLIINNLLNYKASFIELSNNAFDTSRKYSIGTFMKRIFEVYDIILTKREKRHDQKN